MINNMLEITYTRLLITWTSFSLSKYTCIIYYNYTISDSYVGICAICTKIYANTNITNYIRSSSVRYMYLKKKMKSKKKKVLLLAKVYKYLMKSAFEQYFVTDSVTIKLVATARQ